MLIMTVDTVPAKQMSVNATTGVSATECHSATVASHQQAATSASAEQLPLKKFYSSRSIHKPSRFAH